jgi:hypothetical protein|tara:strand:- start:317 stop:544 length:228 start_codon:yes stop_codon:yes gene_type:complete
MNSIIERAGTFVSGLTGILISLLGLGIVANLLFGSNAVIGDVVHNISALVESLGSMGFVGLITLLIVVSLYTDSK